MVDDKWWVVVGCYEKVLMFKKITTVMEFWAIYASSSILCLGNCSVWVNSVW